jgi:hypothetical protein
VFTVEMEDEETTITTIDESGRFGDVKIIMDEVSVGIIQEECVDDMDYSVFIEMSHQQLADLLASMKQPVGAYYIRERRVRT